MKNKNNIEHRAETTLNLRLSKSEKEHLKQAASAAGESITNYIRLCCQLVSSRYVAECSIPETEEKIVLCTDDQNAYHVGDHVKIMNDNSGECVGTITAVTPQWESI